MALGGVMTGRVAADDTGVEAALCRWRIALHSGIEAAAWWVCFVPFSQVLRLPFSLCPSRRGVEGTLWFLVVSAQSGIMLAKGSGSQILAWYASKAAPEAWKHPQCCQRLCRIV